MKIPDTYIRQSGKSDREALAFYLYFKSRIPNSIVYGYCNKNVSKRSVYERYAQLLDMDYRTVKAKLRLLMDTDLMKRSMDNAVLVKMEREFVYNRLPDGKRDRHWNNKYTSVTVLNKKVTLKECRSIVSGLIVKVETKKISYSRFYEEKRQVKGKRDKFFLKKEKTFRRLGRDFSPGRGVPCSNVSTINLSIFKLASLMQCSKSSAERIVNDLVRLKIVGRVCGERQIDSITTLIKKFKVTREDVIKKVSETGGCFIYGDSVFTKKVNSYVF